ncbi:rhomboid family intramembrane serine protease [Reichenbachiella agariperforans]|nr:rhomboid family intramembrane serine protease [Reichenbachiella agariperforans]MBU2913445.1 rhomboid family intramembrane serine protease [Reichenbachiella agariperforans]
MENYTAKFKHIAPTFIYVAFGTTIATLLFRWVFTINSEILPIKEDIFNIWLPLILPWIPITIWLRPKLRILKFKDPDRLSMLYQMIAWGTMVAMMIVSNGYLKTATGKLVELNSIEQSTNLDTRFLKLKKIELNRELGSAHTDFRASGKYNQYLNFDSYFVYPFTAKDSNGKYKYWYGVKINDQISNKIEPEEKERKYQAFFQQAIKNFEVYKFSEPDYFEVLPHSDDREGFLNAVMHQEQFVSSEPIIIEPKDGLYSSRNGKKFEWIFGSFGIGFSVFLFALIFPKYHAPEHKRQLKGIKPQSDDLIDMLKFLIPKDEHYATSIILDLNILIFLLMIFSGVHIISPNGLELLEWGANRRAETTGGDWWRLISSMFLHGGIMHLFLNIYGLVIAALFIEPIFGRTKYFILYFVSGICGSLASIYWYENTISVGASGAIFGLYGAILGLLLTSAFPKDGKKGILMFIGPYVGINLLFGLTGGIDNAAHIGGLISGAVLGIILYVSDKNTQANRVDG